MKYLVNRKTKEHYLVPADCSGVDWDAVDIVEADSEGWIPHTGKDCPLPDDVWCEIKCSDNSQSKSPLMAKSWRWNDPGLKCYRPILEKVQEPMSTTDWNKAVRDSTDKLLAEAGYDPDSSLRHGLAMMNFDKPIPAQLTTNTLDLLGTLKRSHEHAQQIPFLEAELRRELAGMGYTLGKLSPFVEPTNSTAVVAERETAVETPQDMTDWRNWREGDVLECVNGDGHVSLASGNLVTVRQVQFTNGTIMLCHPDGFEGVALTRHFRFHSRPAKGE